ncbi:type 1 glutamine amidotransferase domain-containing protein [Actinospica robiniae]|uniref:type 1 glutamine amidotransferase domain-containing protein n=1 Tax=Actinospica robiniae TaxID=304901 RepID=UPI00041D6185|nr:type 1 glutamine amidotransferase domain-containing protein [Actinospica robiniae]
MGTNNTSTASARSFDRPSLEGREIAFLIAPEGAEESETMRPWEAVAQAGGHPVLISPTEGEAQLFDHLDRGRTMQVDRTLTAASPADYDALVLPGGVANPDMLRTDPEAVAFARAFFEAGKPVAAICHAPWLLVEAGLVEDRALTSWPSLHTDVTNAGGNWRDEEVVVCESGPNTLITSRKPQDLPAFCDTFVEQFAQAVAR